MAAIWFGCSTVGSKEHGQGARETSSIYIYIGMPFLNEMTSITEGSNTKAYIDCPFHTQTK